MIKILKQENEELSNLKLGIKTTTPVRRENIFPFTNENRTVK